MTSALPRLCPAKITSLQLQIQAFLMHPNSFVKAIQIYQALPFFLSAQRLPDSPCFQSVHLVGHNEDWGVMLGRERKKPPLGEDSDVVFEPLTW